MNLPLNGRTAPGVPKTKLVTTVALGATPATTTFQLPEYGVYIAQLVGYQGTPDNMASLTAIVTWFHKNDGYGTVHKTDIIGPSTISRDAIYTPHVASITLSDPDVSGVLTATQTWTGGVTWEAYFSLNLFALRDLAGWAFGN